LRPRLLFWARGVDSIDRWPLLRLPPAVRRCRRGSVPRPSPPAARRPHFGFPDFSSSRPEPALTALEPATISPPSTSTNRCRRPYRAGGPPPRAGRLAAQRMTRGPGDARARRSLQPVFVHARRGVLRDRPGRRRDRLPHEAVVQRLRGTVAQPALGG